MHVMVQAGSIVVASSPGSLLKNGGEERAWTIITKVGASYVDHMNDR